MLPSNIELLMHIYDETEFILASTDRKERETVIEDAILSRAIIRSLEIIGEAAAKLNPAFKARYPHIEWRKITNTRNRLIHDYFGVDYEIVWDIIVSKIPILNKSVFNIIEELKSDNCEG